MTRTQSTESLPDDWIKSELGKECQITSGGTPARKTPKFWNGTIPWVTTSQIDFCTITNSLEKISFEGVACSSAKVFPSGTVLLAMYGQGKTRGKAAILGMDSATNQACAAVLPGRRVNHVFLFYYLCSQYSRLREIGNSGTQKNLSAGLLKRFSLPLPCLAEQQGIASLLECWDKAIRSNELKIEKKRKIKKGLIQRLLSGRQRLPAFSEEWKMTKLEDFGTFGKGKGISKAEVTILGLPCIRYGQIYQTDDYVRTSFHSFIGEQAASSSTLIAHNDLLFTGSGETIDEIGKSLAYMGRDKAYAGGDLVIFSPKPKKCRADYLSFYMNSEGRRAIRCLGQGQSVVHIYSSNLASITIPLPSTEEQKAIVSILMEADSEVKALECKQSALKEQKRYLLNNLITGTIRLPQFLNEGAEA